MKQDIGGVGGTREPESQPAKAQRQCKHGHGELTGVYLSGPRKGWFFCRVCNRASVLRWQRQHPEWTAAKMKTWRKKNPEKHAAQVLRSKLRRSALAPASEGGEL